jgi:hypothetical protein
MVLPHQIDHIIPLKHHGSELLDNLALACSACNNHKGTNLVGVDTRSKKVVRLFDPRHDHWRTHFRWNGAVLVGKTAIGRVTVDVLSINLGYRVELRQELIQMKLFRA